MISCFSPIDLFFGNLEPAGVSPDDVDDGPDEASPPLAKIILFSRRRK